MKEVASLAGVSIATVSRVLNSPVSVSAAAQERVQDAIARLDYVSNTSARTLRPGVRSMTWGLLVDDVDSHYFGRLVDELDRAAQAQQSTLLVAFTQKHWTRERSLIKEMISRRVDGLLVVPADGDDSGERARLASQPVVYLDRIPRGISADVVTFDYYRAVSDQVEDLWSRGHRRIAFVGGVTSHDPGSRRYAAWADKLREHGGTIDPALVSVNHRDDDRAGAALARMLESADPPTAVVTTTGGLLVQLLRTVSLSGAQIEIVGSEDVAAAFLSPVPLTLLQADLAAMARIAADLLTSRIDGDGDHDEPQVHMLPTNQISYGNPNRTIEGARIGEPGNPTVANRAERS